MTPVHHTLTILGATGSIGVSTLDVVARYPERFSVYALTGASQIDKLFQQALQFKPRYAVVLDEAAAEQLRARLRAAGSETEVLCGADALIRVSVALEVTAVMAAIVGAAGMPPTLAAAKAGKRVLLANKETLVLAGQLFMDAVSVSGAELLPIDSEHNAIFQVLPRAHREHPYAQTLRDVGVKRILLTASGGPFRTRSFDTFAAITPVEAVKHPKWSMGRKISVDSASLMNKGLEVIEARWLFNAQLDEIAVVVHPQSIVHSMVEYADGSVLAQLGEPDMRTPIAYGLAYPERVDAGVKQLDLFAAGRLDFEAPDYQRFPCLRLAFDALRAGGAAPAILNAANEVAVAAFLDEKLSFVGIPALIEQVLNDCAGACRADTLQDLLHADTQARESALRRLG
ncbi:1-deoxy-D-xylulose 5-phosphate reductoisomerase [Andreprevotia lacus DSM 23236]|jgi:1-deoxy-D-xylulose-5-phosphate reductoisomerase|uniref:1-deoxy-D-xylulose 5-phosphate reductoisomerase n=1 Tax=Andreprevotia lacus DSM 23236 TaxID=1121001 RepID=A0A1W1XLN9_9NEIS|nr:1-deoxy-D-xylulose-5-phosphate reductoisomerase [Andreprevotia lacus]SMC24754.1 1-deoxy-D-xylulose 5-phosphate reductoisomerase [Andreprevotia lacus DSM 23236]